MPGAKIFEVEKNSFTASLISILLVNVILGGVAQPLRRVGPPK
jgi:hypothetical protein